MKVVIDLETKEVSMTKTGEGRVVCVTGASGFIASTLVNLLLSNGYTVKAAVRNLSDPAKVEHLRALRGANQRLRLFQADLMEEGSFDAAVDGCDGVFHTASPVIFNNIKDPKVELIDPAVDGTLNVLRSCLKAPTIKRVVLTSSLATVAVSEKALNSDVMVDETWYSDREFCEKTQMWYSLSKTLAEEAAWKFAKQHGIDLVVINPGLVIGRCLQPTVNTTFHDFLQFIREGQSTTIPAGVAILVDVKDVVQAHVLAFEYPSANGRYCLAAATMPTSQVFETLHRLYPTLSLPKCDKANPPKGQPLQILKAKVESLGINYIPVEQSLKETIELLKERNLLVIP